MKHVWNHKGSIEKLNPQVLERSGLLELFLSSISNSKFISTSEGRKCIACLFNFGPSIIQVMKSKLTFHFIILFINFICYAVINKALQKSFKKFIPLATISDCEYLGEIYFKAWRSALVEQSRADIEFSIQDMMYSAVTAFRTPVGAVEGGVNKVIPMINSYPFRVTLKFISYYKNTLK